MPSSQGPHGPDDYFLMDAIAAGDPAALKAFYDRHAGLVFTVCLRMLHDRGEAEDLLADIFYEIWSRRERYDATRANPRTYLMTLTRSRAIDRQRARPKMRLSELNENIASSASVANSPSSDTEAAEQRRIVLAAIGQLGAEQRQAIEAAYYDGLSHSEIADKLNKPLGTIKTHIRQGLIRMRDALRIQYERGSIGTGINQS